MNKGSVVSKYIEPERIVYQIIEHILSYTESLYWRERKGITLPAGPASGRDSEAC